MILETTIDEQHDKVTLSFTFALHGLNEKAKSGGVNYENSKKPVVFGSRLERGLSDTVSSQRPPTPKTRKSMKEKLKDPQVKFGRGRSLTRPNQSPVDRLFIKELSDRAREREVEKLLQEGADPNAVDYDNDDNPALII